MTSQQHLPEILSVVLYYEFSCHMDWKINNFYWNYEVKVLKNIATAINNIKITMPSILNSNIAVKK